MFSSLLAVALPFRESFAIVMRRCGKLGCGLVWALDVGLGKASGGGRLFCGK